MTANEKAITERFLLFMDFKRMNDKTFGIEAGISAQTLTRLRNLKEPLRGVTFMKTMLRFPELNGNWIIHDRDEMITASVHQDEKVGLMVKEIEILKEQLEFYKMKFSFAERTNKINP